MNVATDSELPTDLLPRWGRLSRASFLNAQIVLAVVFAPPFFLNIVDGFRGADVSTRLGDVDVMGGRLGTWWLGVLASVAVVALASWLLWMAAEFISGLREPRI